METLLDTGRVWIGCLAAYNSGVLHGEWYDFVDAETFWSDVKTVLTSSPEPLAEEWFVADYDGFLAGLDLGEWPDPDVLEMLVEGVAESGEDEYLAFIEALTDKGYDLSVENLANVENDCVFTTDSYNVEEEYGIETAEGCIELSDEVRNYFDFESYGRDSMMNLVSVHRSGTTYLFNFN